MSRAFLLVSLLATAVSTADAAPISEEDSAGETLPAEQGASLDGEGPDLRRLTSSPVPEVESSGYGWRADPIHRRRKFHHGTDFRADRGTPVLAAGAGVVVFSGRSRGYGQLIQIDHGGGLVTRYAHLRRREVRVGDVVTAASRVGQVGATGRATGPHLHFEVRIAGRSLNPVLALHVAELQRTSPLSARQYAQALSPEAQDGYQDAHDPPRRRVAERPRSKRQRERALW